MEPVQIPAWPVSATSMPFEGIHLVISVQSLWGMMGTASELASGATSSRHSLTNSWALETYEDRSPTGSDASINRRVLALASPCMATCAE